MRIRSAISTGKKSKSDLGRNTHGRLRAVCVCIMIPGLLSGCSRSSNAAEQRVREAIVQMKGAFEEHSPDSKWRHLPEKALDDLRNKSYSKDGEIMYAVAVGRYSPDSCSVSALFLPGPNAQWPLTVSLIADQTTAQGTWTFDASAMSSCEPMMQYSSGVLLRLDMSAENDDAWPLPSRVVITNATGQTVFDGEVSFTPLPQ